MPSWNERTLSPALSLLLVSDISKGVGRGCLIVRRVVFVPRRVDFVQQLGRDHAG